MSTETESENIAYMYIPTLDMWVHLTVHENISRNIKLLLYLMSNDTIETI